VVDSRVAGPTRIAFSREGWALVLGLEPFAERLDGFLEAFGRSRFFEERRLLAFLREHADRTGVIEVPAALDVARRTNFHIADALDRGNFELVSPDGRVHVDAVVVEAWELRCGALCGGDGRRYYLPSCEPLFGVADRVR
jgi:hypothetical protein